MKVLSPAGNYQCLKMAVINGADEVYLGTNGFNARNNIEGFSLEELKSAVNFAHIYGVKVHLAVNILFNAEELQQALDLIVNAYNIGVDAFIIQDLGLAYLVHAFYPQIEMHASTQMGIHNCECAKYLANFNFRRLVLSRETPLDEIARIKQQTGLEIEYFVQGALCVCFSGNCYMSSYLAGASGNRGKCKQFCRLPYTLSLNGKKITSGFLLSAKDFNLSKSLDSLDAAGVDAIKIEGRARRPFYVAAATSVYKNLVSGKKVDTSILSLAFTRGYTNGYFDGNGNIISLYPAHIGVPVGKVIDIKLGKKFNEITFSSNRELSEKSTFKLFDNGTEVGAFTAYSLAKVGKNLYKTTTTQNIKSGLNLNLIIDDSLEQSWLAKTRKVQVQIEISAKVNSPLSATLTCGNKKISVTGDNLEKAKNSCLTKSEIEECFAKNEYFTPIITVELQDVFVAKSKLNSFRRMCYDNLIAALTKTNHDILATFKIDTNKKLNPLTDFAIIEDYQTLPNAKIIIYSPETYDEADIKKFIAACEKQNKKPVLDLPNFCTHKDNQILGQIILNTHIACVANNYGQLLYKTELIAGAFLNIYNPISAAVIGLPFLTAEQDFGSKITLPVMALRHCPLKQFAGSTCNKCKYQHGYMVGMPSGKQYKLKRKKISTCTFYLSE